MKAKPLKFLRLHQYNNWMAITYHLAPSLGDKRVVLKPGEVRIKWPDGHQESVKLECRPNHTTVSDMGHEYPVIQNFYGFMTRTHGVDAWVDIASVGICRDDVKMMTGDE